MHYFLYIFRNQIDDELVPKLTKVKFGGKLKGKKTWTDLSTGKEYSFDPIPTFIDDKGKPCYAEIYRDIPFDDEYLQMDRWSYVYKDYSAPLDEISPKTYARLVNAFKELEPELSSKLEELRTDKDRAKKFLEETR